MKNSFVEYHQFDPSKITDVSKCYTSPANGGFQFLTPMYNYTSKSKYPLMIQTGFMDLTSDPFKFMSAETKKYVSIDPNDNSVSHMYKPLCDMAKFTMDHVSSKYDTSHSKEMGPILANYDNGSSNFTKGLNTELKMKNIKFFFLERNGKITSTIYNYNKSKKYIPAEEFNS